jgi:transposase
MKIETVGLDLAKNVLQVHAVDLQGHIVVRKQLRRTDVLRYFAALEPCVIGMEACGSSHYWGRELAKLGHTVRLIAPQFVRPYVKSNKTDVADAEAICEAIQRPHMRFVPVKTQAQQTILSLHRARAGLVKSRTALANQIRGLPGEFGIVLPQGIRPSSGSICARRMRLSRGSRPCVTALRARATACRDQPSSAWHSS